jgi:hypothetical protein
MAKTNCVCDYQDEEKGIKVTGVTLDDIEFLKKYAGKLSYTTKRSKWINQPDQHEDYPGQSLVTRNHEVIKAWAEERRAVPATVPGTEYDGRLGVLRFNFPGYGGEELEEVSWDKWFETFDERELVFVFQEHLKNGSSSNFFQIDSPFREHE